MDGLSKFKQPLQPPVDQNNQKISLTYGFEIQPTQSWKASLTAVGTFEPLITFRSSLARIVDNSEVVNAATEENNNESKRWVNPILPFAWLNMFGMQTTEAIYLHQFLHRCAPSQKILSVDTCGDIHCIHCISYTKDKFFSGKDQ